MWLETSIEFIDRYAILIKQHLIKCLMQLFDVSCISNRQPYHLTMKHSLSHFTTDRSHLLYELSYITS